MEETLGPLEDGETFLVERGDIRRRAGKNPLELLGAGRPVASLMLPRSFPIALSLF